MLNKVQLKLIGELIKRKTKAVVFKFKGFLEENDFRKKTLLKFLKEIISDTDIVALC